MRQLAKSKTILRSRHNVNREKVPDQQPCSQQKGQPDQSQLHSDNFHQTGEAGDAKQVGSEHVRTKSRRQGRSEHDLIEGQDLVPLLN